MPLLEKWDATIDGDSSDVSRSDILDSPVDIYEDEMKSLTLHKHARLVINDQFPLSSLLKPIRQGWSVDTFRDCQDNYFSVPRLDIRHLGKCETLNETLQSCAWLLQQSSPRCHTAAKVHCRSEVVMPLLETVSYPSSCFSWLADSPIFRSI